MAGHRLLSLVGSEGVTRILPARSNNEIIRRALVIFGVHQKKLDAERDGCIFAAFRRRKVLLNKHSMLFCLIIFTKNCQQYHADAQRYGGTRMTGTYKGPDTARNWWEVVIQGELPPSPKTCLSHCRIIGPSSS
jgi:hypothetical protein